VLIPLSAIKQRKQQHHVVVYNSRQKRAFYFATSLSLFIMAAIVVAVWLIFKRPLSAIGLTINVDIRSAIWLVIAFVLIYAIDTIGTVTTPKKIAALQTELEKRTPFMPTKKEELSGYVLLCVCAGVFEEIVYRGYLVTYFGHLFREADYQQTLSVVLPAFVFSISHFYHSVKNIIKAFVLAVLLGYIFVKSGSLVIVMALHFLMNLIGGLLTVRYNHS
jgi:membrane protease YdiL (CAAX protease family)